jgi:hypothetical protein
MTRESDFITVAGQLVREGAITRLSSSTAAGVSEMQYRVHFIDGGTLSLSEMEYRKLKKRFDPPTSRKKSA